VLTIFRERYEVIETLGEGGEAQILKALDRQHDRFVALKVRRVRDDADRDELLHEARMLLALPPHPALPLVREDFFDHDDYVVVMDWVDGADLATLLDDRGRPGLPPSSVLAYLAQAAEALAHLHAQSPSVVHGDVKPANLILARGGHVKLVDFGLSSAPGAPGRRAGTPGYRAPELAAGAHPSRASDVYALAATAFALLTGSAPAGILPGWENVDPVQAEQLEAALRLGMASDPARRPATPGELVERLRVGWTAELPTGVVTFCCSDIEGSTVLWEEHPEAMTEALVRHDELVAGAVAAHGGSLIESMGEGDSTVSVFASATRALDGALAANRALAAEEWPEGIRLAARWGIHTGESEKRDARYLGPAVIRAARVRAAGDGGQILLSEVSSELVSGHLPDGYTLVDLGPHRLTGLGALDRVHALSGPDVDAPLAAAECPYRGLLPFEPGDHAFFFGREAVVDDLVGRVTAGRLVAVVGASGSGKSSVLRAGLMATVADAVLITPGPQAALEVPDEPDLLLVVDQFEELFTVCDDPGRRDAFVEAVLRRQGPVAIGLRADVYGQLGAYPELAAAVAGNQLLLGAMRPEDLERAVTEPARLAGLRLEPGLVELITRDVAAEPGALPLLSHALRATWEQRDSRTLTVAGYRATGGVGSAIARTADATVDSLPDDERHLVRAILQRMTAVGDGSADARRRVPIGDLVPDGADAATVGSVLERLADARLISLDDGTAEIAHEALIREWPRLRGWLEEDRAGLRTHRRLGDAARLWDEGGRQPADLYRGPRLAAAIDLEQSDRIALNTSERAFLRTSVAQGDHERRRLRGLLAGAIALLALAIIGGVVAVAQRHAARESQTAAEREALRSDAARLGALAASAPTLDQSMLDAVAAVQLDDRAETRSDLLATLQHNPAAIRTLYVPSAGLTAMAIDRAARLIATGDDKGTVRVSDARTGGTARAPVSLGAPVGVAAMAFAPDGRTVAVGTEHGRRYAVHVVDVATGRTREVWSRGGLLEDSFLPTISLAYGPRGRTLAIGAARMAGDVGAPSGQFVSVVDPGTGRPLWSRAMPTSPGQAEAHLQVLPDGRVVVSAAGGETLLLDPTRGRIMRRFSIGGNPGLSPDGRSLAIARNSYAGGAQRAAVVLLDIGTGRQRVLADRLQGGIINGLVFTRDGRRVIADSSDGTHVWDADSGVITDTFRAGDGSVRLGATLAGRAAVVTSAGPGALTVWDLNGTQRLGRRLRWGSQARACDLNPCTVVAPNGRFMATTQNGGTVALVDLHTGRLAHTFPAVNGRPLAPALDISRDGRLVATGGIGGTVTIWDMARRTAVRRLRLGAPVFVSALSPDSRLVAVIRQAPGLRDAQVEVRDLRSGATRFVRRVRGGAGGLQFSDDGKTLFAFGCCRGGSTMAAWDARTGRTRFDHTGSGHVTAFTVVPGGRVLLVGDDSGQVTHWDARSGRQLGAPIRVSSTALAQIAVDPAARSFAVAAYDGGVTLWDLRSGKRIGDHFPLDPGVFPNVAFVPDGRLLITAGGAGLLWPVDRPRLEAFACQVASRSATPADWRNLLPGRPYRRVCP